MSDIELELHVDDELYASASGPREAVLAEIRRYWATCAGDGKCTVYEVIRKHINIEAVLGVTAALETFPDHICRHGHPDRTCRECFPLNRR